MPPPLLPAHIEDTVSAIAQVHLEHYRRAGPLHRGVRALMEAAARPAALATLGCVVVGWIALNVLLELHGITPPDPPPFPLLSAVASVAALGLASMILITQRHDDELATHRDQLTLELAILGEQKSAKIIQLLEEMRRREAPHEARGDPETEAMATPADPQAVLDAIKASHATDRSGL